MTLSLVTCADVSRSRHIATLTGLQNPHHFMYVDEGRLYLTDGGGPDEIRAKIRIHSLTDGSLLRSFGEAGGGPGQFVVQPGHSVHLSILADLIVANSGGKVAIFTTEGRLVRELRHPRNLYFFHPLGEGFVGREQLIEDGHTIYRLNRYDGELNFIAPIRQKVDNGLAFSGDFHFQVYDGDLYVGNMSEDLEIHVYDGDGNQIRSISQPYTRPPVTAEQREEHMQRLLTRPGWDQHFPNFTAYREFLNSRVRYPDRFPAAMRMHLADDRIYVLTHHQEDGMRELLVMELDGDLLSCLMVPFRMHSLLQHYPYAIGNRHLYQIGPGQSSGAWHLYATRLR